MANTNQELALNTPIRLAKLLGVPVLHATHCGSITTKRFPKKEVVQTRNLIGATQAILGDGTIVTKKLWSEGAGILFVSLGSDNMKKHAPQLLPEGYWIPKLPDSYINAWNTFNPIGAKYYFKTALPYYHKL